MPFLTNDPLPQCLQPSPLTPLLLAQGHQRGSRRHLSNVKCLRLLTGSARNLPICHSGAVAMLPEDERVPVVDWTDPDRRRRLHVEGYLVEAQSLAGLS